MKALACLAVVSVVLLSVGGPAVAQPEHNPLVDLAAEDFEIRQEASDALYLDETLSTEQLVGWYAQAEQPEVRQRLLAVARHHFLRQMRLDTFPAEGPGSIGVVQSMQIEPPPIDADPKAQRNRTTNTFALVTRVLEGFPASGRLHPLDRVVALDGQLLGAANQNQRFEDLMGLYQAGDTLTLTVQRNGESLDIEIPLANRNALGAMYAFPEFGLTPDFDVAWTEYRQQHFPLVDNNLAPPSNDPE
ncbi:PDZ domain-containing protein [Algisphaera agarilytica]|uniref:PDZ domain-containing protein n=1 Tax=Algisphaera agarilytica TaxID=1385975 RepID=A0A7X0LKM0_9BACT|nr:PDZ domain-containing protein [Algisphaera agarilytica]MBB6430052.1 hypothetical protein [Algisphaera agarilytica]